MATLTTSYQMLDQKLLGTDDYGAKLYIRIYAKYSEQDITNNRSKVQYQARAYFDKSWSIWDRQSNGSVSGTSATTKTFSRSADYGSGETTLDTTEAWVSHNNDGTMSISASANLKFLTGDGIIQQVVQLIYQLYLEQVKYLLQVLTLKKQAK